MSKHRVMATLLIPFMLLSSVLTPAVMAQDTAAALSRMEKADQLAEVIGLLETARTMLPRTSFDPAAVVEEVGSDPGALTDWVASRTTLVPYQGRLRGGAGVLMDGYGNSLDRALLLHALLVEAGHDAVLVQGKLEPEEAAQLLRDQPERRPPIVPEDDLTVDEIMTHLGIDPDDDPLGLGAAMRETVERGQEIRGMVSSRVATQTEALLSLLPEPVLERKGDAAKALSEHWWVRVLASDEKVDYDPSKASALATETSEMSPEMLPESLSHTVTVKVVAEILEENGTLREEILLSHDLRSADLLGTPVMLWHEPVTMPDITELLAAPDPVAAFDEALLAETAWLPSLRVGDEVIIDQVITVDGNIQPADVAGVQAVRAPIGGSVESAMGGAMSMFSEMIPEESEPEPIAEEASAELLAEWLVFEITAPGIPAIEHRRAIFDLLGPAVRADGSVALTMPDDQAQRERAEALIEQIDIGVWGATPSSEFIADITARDVASLMTMVAAQLQGDAANPASWPRFGSVPRLQVPMHAFAVGRWNGATDRNAYLSHPNLVLLRQGGRGPASDEPSSAVALFDIVENGVAETAEDGFAVTLRQGITDTVVEAALAGASDDPRNTAVLFADDLAAGQDWILLRDPAGLDQVDLPPDSRARMEFALSQGDVVVAPPVLGDDSPWWRIDPVTGQTLGIGSTGAGVTWVEYTNLLVSISGWFSCGIAAAQAVSDADSAGSAVASGALIAICFLGAAINIFAHAGAILTVSSAPVTSIAVAEFLAGTRGVTAIAGVLAAIAGIGSSLL